MKQLAAFLVMTVSLTTISAAIAIAAAVGVTLFRFLTH